ncbi:MAG: YibE/F family protein [Tissierellia bacterium]|nr:YibE/F family protein [Tissierellia bacterium]
MFKSKREIIIYISIILISILFIAICYGITKPEIFQEAGQDLYKGRVISIEDVETEEFTYDDINYMENKIIRFKVELTSGPHKGEVVEAEQNINSMYAIQPKEVEEKDKVLLSLIPGDEIYEDEWIFVEFNRTDSIIILTAIFILMIIILGKGKGFSTVLSLVFTILVIFMVFIPSILKGYNIYLSTTLVSIFIIFMSLAIINGLDKKTLCAIVGNIGGILIAGLIAIIMHKILNLTGFVDEDYVYITYMELDKPIDLVAIIWSGIVIGALGAIMDVAMSIASAMNELAENMENKTFLRMLKSGMNIGRDAIGTMTNTLILAYVGSSLATVLLLIVYNNNLLYLFSTEMIVVEVLQAIIGSMGILFAVPVTALFSAYIFTRENNKAEVDINE